MSACASQLLTPPTTLGEEKVQVEPVVLYIGWLWGGGGGRGGGA